MMNSVLKNEGCCIKNESCSIPLGGFKTPRSVEEDLPPVRAGKEVVDAGTLQMAETVSSWMRKSCGCCPAIVVRKVMNSASKHEEFCITITQKRRILHQNHTKTRNSVSKSHKNEELCIENDEFCS